MKLTTFAAFGRTQVSLGWDGTDKFRLRPVLDVGRSPVHRAWQVLWLRGSVRFDRVRRP